MQGGRRNLNAADGWLSAALDLWISLINIYSDHRFVLIN
jgi:hypothetical protein